MSLSNRMGCCALRQQARPTLEIQAKLNQIKRILLLSIVIIGFTFSYSIFDATLPEIVSNYLLIKMSLWTLVMLLSYSIYTWVTIHRPVPPSIQWTTQSRGSVFILWVVFILMGFAILFPSPKHDHFDMLSIVAVAVIGEEILFRGLLWDLINRFIGDKSFLCLSDTIWLTALAFGLTHLQYHHFQIHLASIVQLSYSFGIGLLLGVLRRRTNNVIWPMFAHSAFNSVFNLLLTAMR